jgi:hypothetical protein
MLVSSRSETLPVLRVKPETEFGTVSVRPEVLVGLSVGDGEVLVLGDEEPDAVGLDEDAVSVPLLSVITTATTITAMRIRIPPTASAMISGVLLRLGGSGCG